jgi:hypothetical protein
MLTTCGAGINPPWGSGSCGRGNSILGGDGVDASIFRGFVIRLVKTVGIMHVRWGLPLLDTEASLVFGLFPGLFAFGWPDVSGAEPRELPAIPAGPSIERSLSIAFRCLRSFRSDRVVRECAGENAPSFPGFVRASRQFD